MKHDLILLQVLQELKVEIGQSVERGEVLTEGSMNLRTSSCCWFKCD